MGRRPLARLAAALAALGAFGWAGYTSVVESLPELGIYDGYWMILGASLAVLAAVPWVWRWRREHSLPVIVLAAIAGCWIPLVVIAVRQHSPIVARLRGAWILMGADVVGTAIPVGMACLWLALREPTEPVTA
jgi:drug/metabolite transporter (DMT)-like permease